MKVTRPSVSALAIQRNIQGRSRRVRKMGNTISKIFYLQIILQTDYSSSTSELKKKKFGV